MAQSGNNPQDADHLLEQYKLFRKSIDDTTHDRHTQSRFASGIGAATLGAIFYATITMADSAPNAGGSRGVWIICAVSAFFGAYTMQTLWSYLKQCEVVIRCKYDVLAELEAHLPATPFTLEGALRRENVPKKRRFWLLGRETEVNNTGIIRDFSGAVAAILWVLTVIYASLAICPGAANWFFQLS